MNKDDALKAIAREFQRWPTRPKNPTAKDALIFYGWLYQHRPELLEFPYPGDRWQAVHGYLLRHRHVTD
jgi:hypothetical protein